MRERGAQRGFSLMELLVAIGIMVVIAAVTIPLVTKFVDRGKSGAQSKELEHIQTSMRSLMADAALITVDANSTTAVNAWAGLPKKNAAAIKTPPPLR
jgi:prepilin-type N-terminal cleavage/methylation domain-containing protein